MCVVIHNAHHLTTKYSGFNRIKAYRIYKAYQIKGEPVRMFINGKEIW